MKFSCYLFWLAFFSFNLYASNWQTAPYFEHFGKAHGLKQATPTCVVEDNNGYMWFGTQGGLARFDGHRFTNYQKNSNAKSLPANWITACYKDEMGQLWFASTTVGLIRYNQETDDFSAYYSQTGSYSLHGSGDLLYIGTDAGALTVFNTQQLAHVESVNIEHIKLHVRAIKQQGNSLWLAGFRGAAKYDLTSKQFSSIDALNSIQNKTFFAMALAGNSLWLGTNQGLYVVPQGEDAVQAEHTAFANSLAGKWVIHLAQYGDDMHIATYGDGLYIFNLSTLSVKHIKRQMADQHSLAENYLQFSYRDSANNLYLGVDGYGVSVNPASSWQFGHTKHLGSDASKDNFVRALSQDNSGNVYIATRNGFYVTTPSGTEQHFTQNNSQGALPNDNVFSLYQQDNQGIWLGTYGGGLAWYDFASATITAKATKNKLTARVIFAMTRADDGGFWLATEQGVWHYSERDGFKQRFSTQSSEFKLPVNTVIALYQDSNTLWVATLKGVYAIDLNTFQAVHYGVNQQGAQYLQDEWITSISGTENAIWLAARYGLVRIDKTSKQQTLLTEQHGLPDNYVTAVTAVNNEVWLSTNNGLARVDKNGLVTEAYYANEGLQGPQFINNAIYFNSHHQRLYVGGNNGYNVFNPSKLAKYESTAPLVLGALYINDQPITNFDPTKLELNHRQTHLSAELAALDMAQRNLLSFQYRLVGFDNQWRTLSKNKNTISYTNLPVGQFNLEARYTTNGKHYSEAQTLLSIYQAPAPWFSLSAIALYVLIAVSVVTVIWRLKLSQHKAYNDKQLALSLADAKQQLIDNVSHEFRTPLTLMQSPLQLLQATPLNQQQRQYLELVQDNSAHLQIMVEQMLKLGELSHFSELPRKAQNLHQTLHDAIAAWHSQINRTDLHIENKLARVSLNMVAGCVNSVFNNLISNAIKYCPQGTQVQFQCEQDENWLTLTYQDNGDGLSAQSIDEMFNRFARFNKQQPGSGLGLALVKQIVDAHQGEVIASANNGLTIVIKLPVSLIVTEQESALAQSILPTVNPERDAKRGRLLLVEDNPQMQNVLMQLLCEQFDIECCDNGASALTVLGQSEKGFDIVLTDADMPVMNGYQLLTEMAKEPNYHHIAKVMLTAHGEIDNRLNALDLSVTDFITKPFNNQELKQKLGNLLSHSRAVKARYTKLLEMPLSEANKVSNKVEGSFMERVTQLVDNACCDEQFSSENLAHQLNLSQRSLQLKMRAFTEFTPTEFIRERRLLRACYLLKNSPLSVTQVAQESGFSAASYFSRVFKTRFEQSPSEFRESNSKQELV